MSKKSTDPKDVDRKLGRAAAKNEVAEYVRGVRSTLSPKDREYYDQQANQAIKQIDKSSKGK